MENGPPGFGDLIPRYNIIPRNELLCVRSFHGQEKQIFSCYWGFIPQRACEKPGTRRRTTADQETIHEHELFKDSFRTSRCLIAFSGWYAWRKEQNRQQPYFIKPVGNGPFCFGGLSSDCGNNRHSCAIITSPANNALKHLQTRVPIIIPASEYNRWLDTETQTRDKLEDLLRGIDTEIEYWPVDEKVNNPGFDNESCISPTGKKVAIIMAAL